MMLHQDGSRAVWLEGQPALDLIVTIDDATSTIYSAFLVEEESTASTFRGPLDAFATHGLPSKPTASWYECSEALMRFFSTPPTSSVSAKSAVSSALSMSVSLLIIASVWMVQETTARQQRRCCSRRRYCRLLRHHVRRHHRLTQRVRYSGKTGKHFLLLSISGLDPGCVKTLWGEVIRAL
jgi:hypothetical protein